MPTGGGGGGAPLETEYVILTLGGDPDLPNERVVTEGPGIVITDGGPNSTLTFATAGSVPPVNQGVLVVHDADAGSNTGTRNRISDNHYVTEIDGTELMSLSPAGNLSLVGDLEKSIDSTFEILSNRSITGSGDVSLRIKNNTSSGFGSGAILLDIGHNDGAGDFTSRIRFFSNGGAEFGNRIDLAVGVGQGLGFIADGGTGLQQSSGTGTLTLRTSSTDAIIIDGSQNTTLAGDLIRSGDNVFDFLSNNLMNSSGDIALRLKSSASAPVAGSILAQFGINDGAGGLTERFRVEADGRTAIGGIQGFLTSRASSAQRDAISSLISGLSLYDTTNNKMDFYNGTEWRGFISAPANTLTVGEIPVATAGHEIDGNVGLSYNTVTGLKTNRLTTSDPLMILAGGNPGTAIDSGLIVERLNPTSNAGWFWDESEDEWVAVLTNDDGTTSGNVIIANYQPIRVGKVTVDNLKLDGNTLSSTDLNGNVILNPNGTGVVNVSDSRLINQLDPVSAQDGATKAFVEATTKLVVPYRITTVATTVLATDFTIDADASTAAFTVTLEDPTAVTVGRICEIRRANSGSNIISVTTSVGLINGLATQHLTTQFQTIYLQSTGTNWIIL